MKTSERTTTFWVECWERCVKHSKCALHWSTFDCVFPQALYENLLVELPFAGFFLCKLVHHGRGTVGAHHLASLDPELYRYVQCSSEYVLVFAWLIVWKPPFWDEPCLHADGYPPDTCSPSNITKGTLKTSASTSLS